MWILNIDPCPVPKNSAGKIGKHHLPPPPLERTVTRSHFIQLPKRNQNSFCISITLYIVNLLWFLALQICRGVAVNDLFRHPAGVCAARVAKVRGKDGKSARGSDQFCFLSEPASLCWRCNAVSAPHTTHLTSGAGGGWGMSVLGRSPSSVSSCCVLVKPSWPKTSVEHSPYKRWSNEPSFGKGWALQVKHLHAGKR